METIMKNLLAQSTAFTDNGHIPSKYTCEGENINPPIEISDIPDETKSLALLWKILMRPVVILLIGYCGTSRLPKKSRKTLTRE